MISKKLDFSEPSEAESAEAEPVSRNLFGAKPVSRNLFGAEPVSRNLGLEKTNLRPGYKYIKLWSEYFRDGVLDDINNIVIPTTKIIIPISIVNQIKELRQNKNEWGGEFYFSNNTIIGYEKNEGDENSLNMNIDPNKKLMYHTHPSSKDRRVSPPSEIDIATLFNNSVKSNTSIPHLVFSKEGIYVIYCHPQIINKSNQTEKLKDDELRKGIIDFSLQEYIQDLRILLGYIKFDGGPKKEIEAKINLDTFIEIINKMGFVLKLLPYPTKDLEIEIPDNSAILIGGSNKKYKVFY